MSTMNQLRRGLSQAWETVAEGWNRLRERAGDALTHFEHKKPGSEVESPADVVAYNSPSWGLLAAEVREDGDTLTVKLEVPGMDASDFDMEVVDDYLVVRGEKRVERDETRGRYHVMEVAYGSFERAIPLPVPVDPNSAKARYRNGVLTVTLEKPASVKARRIEVKVD